MSPSDPSGKQKKSSLGNWMQEVRAMFAIAKSTRKLCAPHRVLSGMLLSPSRRVLCTAHSVRPGMVLAKIFAQNRYRPVFDSSGSYEFSIHVPTPKGEYVFNGNHRGNKKTTVAEAWATAAGYDLAVDPTTYSGKIVEKSEANATHDGRVLDGPLKPEEVDADKVYQILVDNSEGDQVVDLRVTMYGGHVPLVYIKRRPIDSRFSNTNTSVEVRDPADIFSQEELEAIMRFAGLVGLDYGEADVLRDNASGKIYIVDSTNGAAGPPNGLTPEDAKMALVKLATAFDEAAQQAIESVTA